MAALFMIAAVLLMLAIMIQMADTHAMPWTCAYCYYSGDDDDNDIGRHRPWYRETARGYRCVRCGARFKEHPDGALVEDRD
jgi:hypothetical protein